MPNRRAFDGMMIMVSEYIRFDEGIKMEIQSNGVGGRLMNVTNNRKTISVNESDIDKNTYYILEKFCNG